MKIKIVQMITGLNNGGSERNLFNLCQNINKDKFDIAVVSLTDIGEYGNLLTQSGINVYCVNLNSSLKIWKLFKLYLFVRKLKPDIIQTWLYHADLIGLIIGKLAGIKLIVWNIRATKLNFKDTSWHVVIIRKICALLSFIPTRIVNCSLASIKEHIKIGYKANKFINIPNGYKIAGFNFDKSMALFNEKTSVVLGFVGRNDPQKDIFNFLNALLIINKQVKEYKVVLVGKISENEAVKTFIINNNLSNIKLLGQRNDMVNVYNTFDIMVLSSLSEAFPNVVAEAMLCGVPCVVTDVGDAGFIVGNTGIVVPIANSESLADGIIQMIQFGKEKLRSMGESARERIKQNFDLLKMIDSYENLYAEIIQSR